MISHLGDEDALVGGVEGVASVALGTSTDTDAQLLSWLLQDDYFLRWTHTQVRHSIP